MAKDKNVKYTEKLLTLLEQVENFNDFDITLWVFDSKPKWTIRMSRDYDKQIKVTIEGDNLEKLIKRALEII